MATTTVTTTAPERAFIPIKAESLPPVLTFEADADPAEVIKALKISGGCKVKGAVDKAILAQVERELRPHIEADVVWEGDFFPIQTRRVEGMIGKSPICAEHIINHPLYQAVCKEFLTTKNWYWSGQKKIFATSDPQLNNSICFSIGPGAWDQPLHRDSWCHQTYEKEVAVYPDNYDRDVGIGWFIAGKPATRENGATRFIPGSHLWSKDRPPQEELAVHAELEPGDAFMMLSSCYHGGSANKTTDQERLLFSCFMTKGWLRQEENQYLAIPKEVVLKMPVHIQQLMGYKLSQPFLGWVESDDPRVVLDPSLKDDPSGHYDEDEDKH
ncbi:uncharacterized protein PV07_03950 [Cladophialophora immunda]|uniref:Phytanoyl-CoA dioxygenase n=1 Tax=Cladophialophora immunda TaxID=569365 RepID=A0A0D1ZW47_9EURO|nr:uncharacterized protein PV07_03950 [Cladophialophora immunda]KIW32401.1 hypothetical protein PV07_03950 [Cladophialophora immunda]